MNYSKYVRNNSITLTHQEIVELFGDREKNKTLITKSQLPLVLSMANSFNLTTSTEFDELFSAGLEGLMTAIRLYDVDNNVTFTYYASICIRSSMINSTRNNHLIKQPIDKDKIDKHMVLHVDGKEEDMWELIPDTSSTYNTEWIDNIEIRERVRDLTSDKSANIYISYYGMGTDKLSTKELMKKYNCTRQGINHHIHRVNEKLRKDKIFLQLIESFTK